MKRYRNFDLLRLLLALEVVLMHLHSFTRIGPMLWPVDPVPGFLALSGFLVLGSLERTNHNYAQFWFRRALRVLPAFCASLALVVCAGGLAALGRTLLYYVTLGESSSQGVLNQPIWSLSCEELAYGVMCVLALFGFYKGKRASAWCAVLFAAAFALLSAHAMSSNHVAPLLLIPPFFIGCAFSAPREGRLAAVWGMALLVGSVAVRYISFLYANPVLPSTLSICLAASGLLNLGVSPLKLPKPPVDISYGMYILHVPVISMLVRFNMPPLVLYFVGLGSAFAVGTLSAVLLERPFLRLKERLPKKLTEPEPLLADTQVVVPA